MVTKPMRARRHHTILFIVVICLLHRAVAADGDGDDRGGIFFTRHDRDAYLAASGRDVDVDVDRAKTREKDGKRRHRSPPSSRDQRGNDYDDPGGCTLYLAQSSIPNSGLGMYTAVPYRRGDPFPLPEMGIMLSDPTHGRGKLLASYPWISSLLGGGKFECDHGESMVPGLGMLANSHLGLWNVKHWNDHEVQRWRDGTDSYYHEETSTLEDAGRGAASHHSNVRFVVEKDIAGGEELFVSYGDEWFKAREGKMGIVPGEDHYVEADKVLREFHSSSSSSSSRSDGQLVQEEYDVLLSEALSKDKRLRAALPDDVRDVPDAAEMGTARFSARDSIRPPGWLSENGACLDNMIAGTSTLPQAGRGAFATRSIRGGAVVTTTPLLTLDRRELMAAPRRRGGGAGSSVEAEEGADDDDDDENDDDDVGADGGETTGHQLLLNYCYGHPGSSLLLYPYAPTVNFVNHGGAGHSNAELRWSEHPYHESDWLNSTLEEMKSRTRTGLMFDIVATRDIRRGEEVLLDYGGDWEESWDAHVGGWMDDPGGGGDRVDCDADDDDRPRRRSFGNDVVDRLGLPTVSDLNVAEKHPIVRTAEEQAEDPYPAQIMTVCDFDPPEECAVVTEDGHCHSRWKKTIGAQLVFPCTVMSRVSIGGMDWYTALVVGGSRPGVEKDEEKKTHIVDYMPRTAVVFADRPYARDQYARGVFRREVGLPDGLMPPHWMDLISK
jgi:hypothetical protein